MNFQIYIDDVLINDEPLEMDQWADEAVFDRELNTVMLNFPSELTFTGDGYAYLKQQKELLGFVGEATIVVNKQDSESSPITPVHTGIIFMSTCRFSTNGEVVCKITDDSFNARIRVNRDIKGYVNTTLSKNGITIGATQNLRLSLHNQTTGTYDTLYAAYDLLQCLKWSAKFMSDNTIDVVSDYYDSLDTTENNTTLLKKIAIITGEEIKQKNSGFAPHVSWQMLSEFMVNTFNLVMGVEKSDSGSIQIRFEPEEYWEGSAIVELSDIPEILSYVNESLLYSSIQVGSRAFVKDENSDDGYPLPLIPTYTNGQEQYFIAGTANNSSSLDLTTEICTDTNAIYELFQLGNQDNFDDVVFAIEYWRTGGGTNQSMKSQYYNSNYLYNQHLTTGEILNRHRFFGNVTSQYGDDDDTCLAILTDATYSSTNLTTVSGTSTIEPFKFDNDYSGPSISTGFGEPSYTPYDTSNNWGNGTTQGNPVSAANSRYTLPAPGFYFFAMQFNFNFLRQQSDSVALTITYGFKRYNSSNVLQQTESANFNLTFQQGAPSLPGSQIVDIARPFFGISGDYIQAFVTVDWMYPLLGAILAPYDAFSFSGVYTFNGNDFWTFLQCANTTNGGGVIVEGDYKNYPAEVDEFEIPIDQDTWEQIRNNLSLGITYSGQDTTKRIGFIESIRHNTRTQSATFKLRRKPNNT